MLEAHILPHLLAASLAAAQPTASTDPVSATVPSDIAAASPGPIEATPAAPTIPARAPIATPGLHDPLEPINRVSYAITQPIDRFIIRPAAIAYKTVVPHPLRDGARNFITNLYEPVVFLNDLLQLRPKRALHTVARIVLNTAVGILGIFDVAKRPPFYLVHHDNGFGDTLGYYGVGPIAYLYLPVLGPTSLRDFSGEVADNFAEPRLLDKLVHPDSDRSLLRAKLRMGQYSAITLIVSGLDQRAENDEALRAIRRSSVDPYATLRSSFLQDRAGEIAGLKARDGHALSGPSLEDPLNDPAAGQ